MTTRTMLVYTAAIVIPVLLVAVVALGCSGDPGPRTASAEGGAGTFTGRVFDAEGKLIDARPLPRVVMDDAAWRERLTDEQYRVVRKAGTERAFTGALLENKDQGVYTCVACGLPLFESNAKFDSGTGWPSYFRPIADGNVGEHVDSTLGMVRREIHCARCDGHLGHVFDDGPRPTGLRYCVNSASLAFTPAAEVAALAEPVPAADAAAAPGATASVVLAGGCFWCVEAVFEELEGVHDAISGYAGGSVETANYRAVCGGDTGHAEAVKIVYDPAKIAYEDLLLVHFSTHDPTQLNRQGNDVGPQYRSAIFYADEQERAIAQAFIEDLATQKVFEKKIVTTLEPLTEFFLAEPHHQNYVCLNPQQSYVRGVALPKVEKVRKMFKDRLKERSPLAK